MYGNRLLTDVEMVLYFDSTNPLTTLPKKGMRLLLVFISGLLVSSLFSQAPVKILEAQPWVPCQSARNTNTLLDYGNISNDLRIYMGDYQRGHIRISEHEKIILAISSPVEYLVLSLTDNMTVKWQQSIPGVVLNIGRFNDKILVVYFPKSDKRDTYNSLCKGLLLDMNSGKVIAEKDLFQGSANTGYQYNCFFWGERNFRLGVRRTKLDSDKELYFGRKTDALIEKGSQSEGYQLLSYDAELNRISGVEVPVRKTAFFQGVEMNSQQELVFLYKDENHALIVQRVNADGSKEKNTVTIEQEVRSETTPLARLLLSKSDPDAVFLFSSYKNKDRDYTNAVIKVNLSTKKVESDLQVINRDFKKAAKNNYTPASKKSQGLNQEFWDYLEWIAAEEVGDYLVVYQEVLLNFQEPSGMNSFKTNPAFYQRDGLITVYDRQMKVVDQKILPKTISYYGYYRISSSMHVRNDKVYIMSILRVGMASSFPFFFEYDLTQKKVTREEIFENARTGKGHIPVSGATIWFDQKLVFLFDRIGIGGKDRYSGDLATYDY